MCAVSAPMEKGWVNMLNFQIWIFGITCRVIFTSLLPAEVSALNGVFVLRLFFFQSVVGNHRL